MELLAHDTILLILIIPIWYPLRNILHEMIKATYLGKNKIFMTLYRYILTERNLGIIGDPRFENTVRT